MFIGPLMVVIDSRLDFTDVDDDTLNELAEACDVATFGVNQENVLDESYRKAGKLDSKFFAPKFNFDGSGLRDIIKSDLLEGKKAEQDIRAELYKLNVYGIVSCVRYTALLLIYLQVLDLSSNHTRIHLVARPCSALSFSSILLYTKVAR